MTPEDRLRTLLQDRAEEMDLEPALPRATLRRAGRRRAVTVLASGATVAAMVGVAFAGVNLLADRDETKPADDRRADVAEPAPAVDPPDELQRFVDDFMRARVRHEDVEALMTPEAMNAYNDIDSGLSLFKIAADDPGYGIADWRREGEDRYAVELVIDEPTGKGIVEELELGPGTTVTGTRRDLVLLGARIAAEPGVRLEILNGTDEDGLAAATAEFLEQHGYVIEVIGNASKTYEETVMAYRQDSRAVAEELKARFFPEAHLEVLRSSSRFETQVVVVVGEADAERLGQPTPPAYEPTQIRLLDGSGIPGLAEAYVEQVSELTGVGVLVPSRREPERPYARTTIFVGARGDEFAQELKDGLFPAAEIRQGSDAQLRGSHVLLILGQELDADPRALASARKLLRRFMDARVAEEGSEMFLSRGARERYSGDLRLYARAGTSWLRGDFGLIRDIGDGRLSANLMITTDEPAPGDGCTKLLGEELVLGPGTGSDGVWRSMLVLDARPAVRGGYTGYSCPE